MVVTSVSVPIGWANGESFSPDKLTKWYNVWPVIIVNDIFFPIF